MTVERLHFFGMHNGKKALSIAADSFVIEKKKIGFFTFSVAHVARLENARIDIYSTTSGNNALLSGVKQTPAGESTGKPETPSPLSYTGVLAQETLAGFPVPLAGISSLEAAPILVRFFTGDRLISTIEAASASIRISEKTILFSGNVRVQSGAAEMTTHELAFLPDKGHLQMRNPYSLRHAGVLSTGERLTTDIRLNPVNP